MPHMKPLPVAHLERKQFETALTAVLGQMETFKSVNFGRFPT